MATILQSIFLNAQNMWISFKILLKFVFRGTVNKIQMMAWRQAIIGTNDG